MQFSRAMLLGKLVEVRGSLEHLLPFVSVSIRVSPHDLDGHNAHGYRYCKGEELLHVNAVSLLCEPSHGVSVRHLALRSDLKELGVEASVYTLQTCTSMRRTGCRRYPDPGHEGYSGVNGPTAPTARLPLNLIGGRLSGKTSRHIGVCRTPLGA